MKSGIKVGSSALAIVLCLCAAWCHAQTTQSDDALLKQVRDKYDAPFQRGLQSFDCGVEFSWKQHFTETARVGDEGTDKELETLFQPIRTRVAVTRERVTTSANLSEEAIHKLPYGGMAQGLLQHAVEKSLYTWLPAATNTIIPDSGTPVSFDRSQAGYKMAFKMQTADIEMALASDMRLQSAAVKGPQGERFDTAFTPGPQGFLLSSWNLAEDGNNAPGHRLIFTFTYQTVEGFQLPERVTVTRESHHEVWRYKLTGCTVKTSK